MTRFRIIANYRATLLLLLLVATLASGQDSIAAFWKNNSADMQDFDIKKLNTCYKKILSLPPATLDLNPVVNCPAKLVKEEPGNDGQSLAYWLHKAQKQRLAGYRDCSNAILESLLKNKPDRELKKQLDIYVELAFNSICFYDFRMTDSLASRALELLGNASFKHGGTYYIAAYANHRNRRSELARQQVGEALDLARKEGDRYLQGRILSLMGIINRDMFFGQSLKAIPFHEQALAIAKEIKDTSLIINELISLGNNYNDAGQTNLRFEYLLKAIELLYKFEDICSRIRIQNITSDDLTRANRFEESERLRLSTIYYAEACHSLMTSDLYIRLHEQYLKQQKYPEAKAALDKTHSILLEGGMGGNNLMAVYEAYYALAKVTGQTDTALLFLEKAYNAVNENYMKRNSEILGRFEVQFKTGEKEKLLAEKEKLLKTTRFQRTMVITFAILLLLLAGAVLVGFLRQKNTNKILSGQNKLIQQQAEELKSLEGLKSRFFANVSHELRTPLTLILGPVNSMLKHAKKENDDKSLLQLIQRNALQLQKLINEILDLSKLESNKLELIEKPVLLLPYLKDQMAQFYSFTNSNQIRLDFDHSLEESLRILIDINKLEKIVQNLLSNAMKFTPPGGKVTVTVNESDEQIQIAVTDTGQGIHPDDLPYIFDRFYQSKLHNAKTEGGTGIGLSLCRELALLLGGDVSVKSEWTVGSTFYFRFPKKVANEADVIPESTGLPVVIHPLVLEEVDPRPRLASDQPTTILIVEDNADLRQYLQLLLADYRVITAENGQKALVQLEQHRDCHLIISDLMMPVMDGIEFLGHLKSDDRWRHLPVIMLTAKVNQETKIQALRIGVDDYLNKPFQEEELIARIDNLLHNYHQRMSFFSTGKQDNTESNHQEKPVISEVDNEWLQQVELRFSKSISNKYQTLDWVAQQMHISERQFHRRIQRITGLTPNQYLQEMRLQQAKEYLTTGKYSTIKEISSAVGYQDTIYFSRLFNKRFGVMPSAYQVGMTKGN